MLLTHWADNKILDKIYHIMQRYRSKGERCHHYNEQHKKGRSKKNWSTMSDVDWDINGKVLYIG